MNKDTKQLNRRDFINITVGGIALSSFIANPSISAANQKLPIKAIAFDAFPIFDARPVFDLVNTLFPDKGVAITNSWKTAQFEYTWLRTSAKQYTDFWKVTEDALVFAAKKNEVNLTDANRKQLMESYLYLNAWPDVLPVLKSLKEKGIRLSIVSNLTHGMLNSCAKNAGLEGYFEHLLSTDIVKANKPNPAAYQMAINSFKLKKQEIAFAAFAGWDAVGAKWFGYPTYWVNRQNLPLDELSVVPDGVGKYLTGLADFIK